ncbi:MAG: DEAD/DEAH box helicase [Verrucomicrobiota bacterium]
MQRFQFHPVVATWFEQKFGSPTEPQERGWPAIQSGAHTLIAAPTGSGKTLAAFMAALDRLFRDGLEAKLNDQTRVLYVSPLKALSNDIHKNLEEPLAGIRAALRASEGHDIEVRAEVRTGDTSAAKRRAIIKTPPHILVTTPESFYLLLTSESGRKILTTVRTLIVDEIHAVVSNRRGSHLALSMERLSALVKGPLQRIGLSATQKPIEEVARFLVGGCGHGSADGSSARLLEAAAPLALETVPGELLIGSDGQAVRPPLESRAPPCTIVDSGHSQQMDLAIELPGSPLEAVMSTEVWAEVYNRLADLIEAHRTTLVFVNTRRLAERVTHHLCERLGKDKVTSHHGSLSAKLRLDAENRLKRGELKALVATTSLELGIDIGSVDLVCQLGSTRSIATFLQRIGRAEHKRGGLPKGRIFPLTRDELVECVATLRCVRRGELDSLQIPEKPLDILAQQIVACAAGEDWDDPALFDLVRSAYPYRNLTRQEFNDVVRMLAEGFSTKRGRRGALIHHDAVNHRVRARRGARLVALTSGGAIPDSADYRVVLEPSETFIGTVNEDFAIESMAGDIFQLGNASWRILRINSGQVRVEDARGQPPGIPFWLGEAPARTAELSRAISELREGVEKQIRDASCRTRREALTEKSEIANRKSQIDQSLLTSSPTSSLCATQKIANWLKDETGLSDSGARQLADYFFGSYQILGLLPSQKNLVLERFFDESGGMQLVIHAPFGARLNRAWGLALRKRFCRTFNFELQAAATDDAIVLSLGTQHSFPLDEVIRYLNSKTVGDLLVQALLDAPMFTIRWRWNAARSLALPRQRGGRRIPAPLQRMEAENLLAAVFPDQLACLEHIVGDREIPGHPLVRQTIEDCLTEAMDIEGLVGLLQRIEKGEIQCTARDLPEPSPLAHEILNARPYAFLDNAPLEERRTRAVYTRRSGESKAEAGLGILDGTAIQRVCEEAWPRATSADELHDALLVLGVMTEEEVERTAGLGDAWRALLEPLVSQKRAGRMKSGLKFWCAAERLPLIRAVYSDSQTEPPLIPPPFESKRAWEHAEAVRELVRGRMEVIGPIAASALVEFFELPQAEIDSALLALEAEGFVLRGKFHPGAQEIEWCDRRLLARIHRLTINRLRAEIQPVSLAEFQRFLLAWQRVDAEHRAEGPEGVEAVLTLLDGYELPAAAWEPEVLARRVREYTPQWLDQLCFTGRIGWGRLTPPQNQNARAFAPLRSSPIALFSRELLPSWLELSATPTPSEFSPDTELVLKTLSRSGALFFAEIVRLTGLLPSRAEQALGELAAQGWVTADSFEGLRALLVAPEKRVPFADVERKRRHRALTSIEFAGRWSLLRTFRADATIPRLTGGAEDGVRSEVHSLLKSASTDKSEAVSFAREEAIEAFARALLRRYGVVFRRLLERESLKVSWFELGRAYRQLEARGEIRGGYFVSGVSGEQFAFPDAIGLLRSLRKVKPAGELIALSGADPLNLIGILTPGPRITGIAPNRILVRDGTPIAALVAGQIIKLDGEIAEPDRVIEQALKIGKLPATLRPYYG